MDIIHQDAFYVRFRYIANSYGLLKVRCEREADYETSLSEAIQHLGHVVHQVYQNLTIFLFQRQLSWLHNS